MFVCVKCIPNTISESNRGVIGIGESGEVEKYENVRVDSVDSDLENSPYFPRRTKIDFQWLCCSTFGGSRAGVVNEPFRRNTGGDRRRWFLEEEEYEDEADWY